MNIVHNMSLLNKDSWSIMCRPNHDSDSYYYVCELCKHVLCLPDSSKFIHLIFANCVLLYLLYTAYQRGGNHRSHLLSGEQCSEKTIQFKIQSFLIFS